MASRGDRTREQLLDAAERLYSEEGVGNVSFRQIRIAAGQKNQAAVQYYFGDRDGIIAALSERHTPRIQAIQDELVAGTSRPSFLLLVQALVRPMAEYSGRGPSERAWIKILAELLSDPRLSLDTIREQAPPRATDVGVQLFQRLTATLPADVASERLWAVAQFAILHTADRARIKDDPKAVRNLTSDDAFIRNLVAMAAGALRAKPLPDVS